MLRTFASATGRTSAGAYEVWLRGQPKPNDYPSTKKLRALFGGPCAHVAAIAFGLPQSDPSARRLRSNGRAQDPDEILAAVKIWAESEDRPLTEDLFLSWTKDQARRDDYPLVLPLSRHPIR